MKSAFVILGEPLFARGAEGRPICAIATAFPARGIVVSQRGTHACQRGYLVDWLNQQRREAQQPPLSQEEQSRIWFEEAVDLIVFGDVVQIRAEPDRMALALEADELLQTRIAKHRIRFIGVLNKQIREAVKRRGECWRITPMPMSRTEMKQRLIDSKIAIRHGRIYYYNCATGTRYLTCHEFERLADLDDESLRQHLAEIREFSASRNVRGRSDLAFFMADASFSRARWAGYDFSALGGAELRRAYEELRECFAQAVPPEFRQDNPDDAGWRNRMFSSLIAENDEVVAEETLLGLSPEFFMQIRWLPGGRIVNGELVFDEVFKQKIEPGDPSAIEWFDENAREFLLNFVREYDDLEYVNIGRVVNSLSRRLDFRGRRDVFLAVVKQRGQAKETVSLIRMQKWGVREHLEEGGNLLKAMYDSEEYTEYVLDRRVGCRQLCMNILQVYRSRKICEQYRGFGAPPEGIMIWSPYFERAYVRGIATDKIPGYRYADPQFALRFARLLGMAAAPNLIVGRCDISYKVLFDDGDEVLVEDEHGMPGEIVVADQKGTFWDFRRELQVTAPAYADPVIRRAEFLPAPEQFARVYIQAFLEKFTHIQEKCRKRRGDFERMFQNRPYDVKGSFAYRWEQVLRRLDRADPAELAAMISAQLTAAVRR